MHRSASQPGTYDTRARGSLSGETLLLNTRVGRKHVTRPYVPSDVGQLWPSGQTGGLSHTGGETGETQQLNAGSSPGLHPGSEGKEGGHWRDLEKAVV